MNIVDEVKAASIRIESKVLWTPLIESKPLSELIKGSVFLKLESEQHTGSFKARGALNKILSLSTEEKSQGLVTASTGNHAQGFARAVSLTGDTGIIYMPENASKAKIEALKQYPVTLHFHGRDSLTTELYAKEQARIHNQLWISPYNDPQVIGGQGTIAVEVLETLPEVDQVLITVGGGGLISGIGSYMKVHSPQTKIVGCLPENSAEMAMSLEKGEVVVLDEHLDTLSDGSAGGVELGSITFPICQQVVDECILVNEAEIADGINYMAHQHRKIIEGSAGVVIAALKKQAHKFENQNVVLLICGGNIDLDKWKKIV